MRFEKIEDSLTWDTIVKGLDEYSFLNSFNRLEYLRESGREIFRYGIFLKDKPIGVISGSFKRSKTFGKYMECQHSPLLSIEKEEYWCEILNFCKQIATNNDCFMYRISPLIRKSNSLLSTYEKQKLFKAPVHNIDALITQHFDLSKNDDDLRHDMSSSSRNNVNKLLKNTDVSVRVFDDNSQLDVLGDFYDQTKKYKGYTGSTREELLKELEAQIKGGMCYLLVGYYKDKPISVWQATVYGENMHIYQAGSDIEFREKNIRMTYLLFWESVLLGKRLGCKTLDLFGGMTPVDYQGKKHPWRGVNSFKESLGGEKITYLHSRDFPVKRLNYLSYYILSYLRTAKRGYTVKW